MSTRLPNEITRYFWGDTIQQLSWTHHRKYIVQTVLNRGDSKAIQWLLHHSSRSELLQLLPSLHLDEKSRNFWQLYLT